MPLRTRLVLVAITPFAVVGCMAFAAAFNPEESLVVPEELTIRVAPPPLIYRHSWRACKPGFADGYKGSDGSNIVYSAIVFVPGFIERAELYQELSQATRIIEAGECKKDGDSQQSERYVVELVEPQSGPAYVTTYDITERGALTIAGPGMRHIEDVARIEAGDRRRTSLRH